MPHASHDLAAMLRALDGHAVASRSLTLPGFEMELLRIPAGQRHEHMAAAALTLLVLAGVGSVALDDWRTTLSGGHLLAVPGNARLTVTADGGVALELLLTRPATPDAPGE